MFKLIIIIILFVYIQATFCCKSDVKRSPTFSYKISKDFPIDEDSTMNFEYEFAQKHNVETSDLIFAIHREGEQVENAIVITRENAFFFKHLHKTYMQIYNYQRTKTSIKAEIQFTYFADGMKLSVYYFDKGSVDNRKNFIFNAGSFWENRVTTKTIKVIKGKGEGFRKPKYLERTVGEKISEFFSDFHSLSLPVLIPIYIAFVISICATLFVICWFIYKILRNRRSEKSKKALLVDPNAKIIINMPPFNQRFSSNITNHYLEDGVQHVYGDHSDQSGSIISPMDVYGKVYMQLNDPRNSRFTMKYEENHYIYGVAPLITDNTDSSNVYEKVYVKCNSAPDNGNLEVIKFNKEPNGRLYFVDETGAKSYAKQEHGGLIFTNDSKMGKSVMQKNISSNQYFFRNEEGEKTHLNDAYIGRKLPDIPQETIVDDFSK